MSQPVRRSPVQRSPSPNQAAPPETTWGPAALAGQTTQRADWSLVEVRAFLADYGIKPKYLDATPLPGGWENLNLRLDVDGTRYVLRRYDSTEPADVPWGLALLSYVAARGFPTPAPVKRTNGALLTPFRSRAAALFPFVDGRHPEWDEPNAPIVAAGAIGRLHQITEGLTLSHPRPRHDDLSHLKRFHTWLAARQRSPQDEPLHDFAREAVRYEDEFMRRLESVEETLGPLPRGVVHADAHGNNLLVNPDDSSHLIALIDFDDAHESFLLTDVCSLVDIWGLDRGTYEHDPARTRRVLGAYTGLRPLTLSERELFPDVLALVNLAGTTSYVTSRVKGGANPAQAIADCDQYASYHRRTAGPAWRAALRELFFA